MTLRIRPKKVFGLREKFYKRFGVDLGQGFEERMAEGAFQKSEPIYRSRELDENKIRKLTFKSLQGRMNLLTLDSAKAMKSFGGEYLVAMMYLLPHTLGGGPTLCPHSTPACRFLCLNVSGKSEIGVEYDLDLSAETIEKIGNPVLKARLIRTRLYRLSREYSSFNDIFLKLLYEDIDTLKIWTAANNMKPAIRLNGTSDIAWEKVQPEIFEHFKDIQFYDYTKWPLENRGKKGVLPKNYHLTYSISEKDISKTRAVNYLRAGRNVSAVFWQIPKEWNGYPVIDGTETDLRFLDLPSTVCGLRPLARAKKDTSGFVLGPGNPNKPECDQCVLVSHGLTVNVYEGAGPIPKGFPTEEKMIELYQQRLQRLQRLQRRQRRQRILRGR